jgi:hypothetical protein
LVPLKPGDKADTGYIEAIVNEYFENHYGGIGHTDYSKIFRSNAVQDIRDRCHWYQISSNLKNKKIEGVPYK